ncbi:MAG: ribosome biogenesis GTPase YlqF [Clostridia bacterium]|nr:ribosome biogenesis GTPase YlqF [Clostridia bacterium]
MINWFPGHMSKTLKEMQNNSKLCDCFVYVLDARCPQSCINPEFLKVVKDKPIVFVLNKADLVESADIKRFKEYFNSLGHECVSLNATVSGNSKIIVNAIRKIFAERLQKNKERQVTFVLRAMVIGIPNSGKSTIVNNLCNKGRAITGNKAGVTRSKQWIKVGNDIEFMDTPGVLLPNFENEDFAYNLAFVGSVRDDVLNLIDVCERLIRKLREMPSKPLQTKYSVDFNETTLDNDILKQIGKKRGCLIKGGEIDMERAAKILLTDFRAGKLGKIVLEQI